MKEMNNFYLKLQMNKYFGLHFEIFIYNNNDIFLFSAFSLTIYSKNIYFSYFGCIFEKVLLFNVWNGFTEANIMCIYFFQTLLRLVCNINLNYVTDLFKVHGAA